MALVRNARRFNSAHPNSLYCTLINRDPELKRRYREWLREADKDAKAMQSLRSCR